MNILRLPQQQEARVWFLLLQLPPQPLLSLQLLPLLPLPLLLLLPLLPLLQLLFRRTENRTMRRSLRARGRRHGLRRDGMAHLIGGRFRRVGAI